MGIKISDLAAKLGLQVKELRAKVQAMHLGISSKANVFRDEMAEEILRRLESDKKPELQNKEEVLAEEVIKEEELVKFLDKEERDKYKVQKVRPKKEKKEDLLIKTDEAPVEEIAPIISGKSIDLPAMVTVGELAAKMGLPVAQVIKELMKNGVLANINEHIDFDTASIIASDLGFETMACAEEENIVEQKLTSQDKYSAEDLKSRPPIVTVMGHVDHGKTSILDKIRETNVVMSESGGITQHIGAYQVKKNDRLITFLDTPGHQAFSAMRAHGAKLTDVAVLVVAADDGVKPQTVEAINHARAAGVPIVVAINKIDKEGANVDKVKRELADYNLSPEEWGGSTVMVLTSAKSGEGIDKLLEMILLVTDLQDIKAYYDGPAEGVVIEAHLSKKVGPVATLLVTQGCLKVRDHVVIGITEGVVRAMVDYKGDRITKAYPADPVRLAGLAGVPEFGDNLYVVNSSQEAKEIVICRKKNMSLKALQPKVVGMVELAQAVKEGKIKELQVILKTDVQGSLEAIRTSLENIRNEEVKVKILHEAVGAVNESDVMMASSSQALILSFRVKIEPNALKLAKKLNVKVSSYDIIYRLLDDVKSALEGMLKPEMVKVRIGRGKVLKVFTHGRKFRVIGVNIVKGEVEKNSIVVAYRNDTKIGEGEIDGLKRGTEDVAKVTENHECGIGLKGNFEILEGDKLEFWQTEMRMRRLDE